jgi:hypothetical protein
MAEAGGKTSLAYRLLVLLSCLSCFDLKFKEMCSPETLSSLGNTRRYKPEDRTIQDKNQFDTHQFSLNY